MKKGKNLKMGNQIYFKIAGKQKNDRRVKPPVTQIAVKKR